MLQLNLRYGILRDKVISVDFCCFILLIAYCIVYARIYTSIYLHLYNWTVDDHVLERYRSLAPMYYRGAAAAIVVYDISKKV
jgi:hypothetical protein